jgi:hypothetical protein
MLRNILVSARNARFCLRGSLERRDPRLLIVGTVKARITRTVTADLFPARVEFEDPPLVSPSDYQLFQAGVSCVLSPKYLAFRGQDTRSSDVLTNNPENDQRSRV